MSLTLDNSFWELKSQRSPWQRSSRRRLGVAFASVVGGTEDEAHQKLWDLLDDAPDHQMVRVTLADAGVDVVAVQRAYVGLEREYANLRSDEEAETWGDAFHSYYKTPASLARR